MEIPHPDKISGRDTIDLGVHESAVEIHAKIVDPEYRRSWVNALKTKEFVSRLRSYGRDRVRFAGADHVHYTLKFAKRHAVKSINVATQFVRPLLK